VTPRGWAEPPHAAVSSNSIASLKALPVLALALLLAAAGAEGQIVRLEITSRESPTFEGRSFGPSGPYERIAGRAYGEVDPRDPRNAIITDLRLAPRNARGRVEYVTDFVILKPVEMARSNGILRYFAPNRGGGAVPTDSLFLSSGTVYVAAAWQGDVPPGTPPMGTGQASPRLTLQVPVARNAGGSPVTGAVRVEFVGRGGAPVAEMPLQGNGFNAGMVPYPPADPNERTAVLTRRVRESDARVLVPRSDWAFATCNLTDQPFPGQPDSTRVCLKGGFQPRTLYELVYTARDPKVMGVGFAAVRDLVSFLRSAPADAPGAPNPLAGRIRWAMGGGISQAGNFLKSFVNLGFNQDVRGRRVFDAIFPLVAARQTNLNTRFAVPGGGGGMRSDHRAFGQVGRRGWDPEYRDEIRGTTGGIFTRCAATRTCPKAFLGFSGTEMWVLQGSPTLTDAFGTRDLKQPDSLRIYYFAGTQHTDAPRPTWNPGQTVYPTGTESRFGEIVRALWVRLEEWMVSGEEPPASRVPSIVSGTLVRPGELKFPEMKGVTFPVQGTQTSIPAFQYLGWHNRLGLLDFGPRFAEPDESGIADWQPPAYMGRDYAILVPSVDRDGNEVGGVQPVGNRVPLGTNLTFNYDADLALHDLAGLSGGFIPFHHTRAGRLAAGDERPSLEERYGTRAGFLAAVQAAASELVREGFLLPEDAARLVSEAEAGPVLRSESPHHR
jgi:hypothetical protein